MKRSTVRRAPAHVLGTAHPAIVIDWATDGSWVVLCQAREDSNGDGSISVGLSLHGAPHGDEMVPYLIRGDGPGEALDAFLGSSEGGKHLAVVKEGKLRLLTIGPPDRDIDLSALGADLRDDSSPFGTHRAASFDGLSNLLYLRDDQAILRRLDTGAETAFSAPGSLYRATIERGSRWLNLLTVPKGAAWPSQSTSLAGRHCRGPVASYTVNLPHGQKPASFYVPVSGGQPLEIKGMVRPMGDWLLVREPSGALVLRDARGQREELVPESCGGVLLAAYPPARSVLVACSMQRREEKLRGRDGLFADVAPVEFHAPGRHREFHMDVKLSTDRYELQKTAIFPLEVPFLKRPDSDNPLGNGNVLFDLDKGTATPLREDWMLMESWGSLLLLGTTRGKIFLYDSVAKRRTPLRGEHCFVDDRAGLMLFGEDVVDTHQRALVGRLPASIGPIRALTRKGALVAATEAQTLWQLPSGPFWWEPLEPR